MKPPTNKDNQMQASSRTKSKKKLFKIKSGFIFWIDKRTNTDFQDKASIIPGSHEWKGAAPNLTNKAVVISKVPIKDVNKGIAPNKNKIEANVCVRKYFTADSQEDLSFQFKINGIKVIVFSSKAIQLNSRTGEELIIRTLPIMHNLNNRTEGLKNIG